MRVLLIEDDRKIASFIEKGLKEEGFSVDAAHDGAKGLSMAVDTVYDVAVIDIMLPEVDGLTIIDTMRRDGVKTPVLILSARQSVDDRVQGLQRGGDDYMIKPFSFSELLARIQALIRRDRSSAPTTILQVGDLRMDLLRHEVFRGEESIELPAKEYSLLEYMMHNPDAVLSKTSILEKVYDYSFDPQTNVVDVLVCRLRNKVDKGFREKMIHTVRGMGYVLRSQQKS